MAVMSVSVVAQDDVSADLSKPYVSFSGADSQIIRRSYELITSDRDWTKLWLRHIGKTDAEDYDRFYDPDGVPQIDFNSCMVIAVLLGRETNVAGIEAVSLTEIAGVLTLRIRKKSFGTGGTAENRGGAKAVTPYGFFVIRRVSREIAIEEAVQKVKNDPIKWREVFRFR